MSVIAARQRSGPPCGHVAALLDAHAAELDQRIAELTVLRGQVQRLRERSRTLDPGACEAGGVCHVIPVTEHPRAAHRGRPAARTGAR